MLLKIRCTASVLVCYDGVPVRVITPKEGVQEIELPIPMEMDKRLSLRSLCVATPFVVYGESPGPGERLAL